MTRLLPTTHADIHDGQMDTISIKMGMERSEFVYVHPRHRRPDVRAQRRIVPSSIQSTGALRTMLATSDYPLRTYVVYWI